MPWCTYTDPELARVGLSETEAKQQGIAHRVYRFPFDDIDRARAEGETEGFAKIVTDPRGKLLGAAIVGPHAGELIAEYVLAMTKGMKAADISATIHTYPTLAQINRRVADQRLKEGLTPSSKALDPADLRPAGCLTVATHRRPRTALDAVRAGRSSRSSPAVIVAFFALGGQRLPDLDDDQGQPRRAARASPTRNLAAALAIAFLVYAGAIGVQPARAGSCCR